MTFGSDVDADDKDPGQLDSFIGSSGVAFERRAAHHQVEWGGSRVGAFEMLCCFVFLCWIV
jgi:hypothetical protein